MTNDRRFIRFFVTMMEISERDPLWKRILIFIDVPDMILSIITIAVWLGLSSLEPNYLYIPPHDSNSMFPASTSGFSYVLLCCIVFGGFSVLLIICYFIARFYPKYFREFQLFHVAWGLVFTIAMCNIFVNIPKAYVGRPRPDIYARCGGENNMANCSAKILKGEYKSWPSGHSSTSMSGSIFMAAFFIKFMYSNPISIIIATLFSLFGIYVGATRIRDFRHHPDDVIAGLFLGFVSAYLVWENISPKFFLEPRPKENEYTQSPLTA